MEGRVTATAAGIDLEAWRYGGLLATIPDESNLLRLR